MNFENPLLRFITGIILITLLDTLGAISSNKFNFKYIHLIPLSLAIYVFTGYILAKVTDYQAASLYLALLGLFDGTIGLKLSVYCKANTGLDENKIREMQSVQTGLAMALTGWIFGSIGFALA